ncbi:MAG TPA: c-type cytochrome [Marmoricola sp.]|nr:c-type cytochrome [Marmoricola sp.]
MRQPRPAQERTRSRRLRAAVLLAMLVVAAGVVTAARAAREPGSGAGDAMRPVAAAMPRAAESPGPSPGPSTPTPTPAPTATPAATPTSTPAPTPLSSNAKQGRTVFLRDCAWCHGEHAQGTGVAPSLLDKGSAAVDFWLSTGRMPLQQPDQRAESGPPSYSPGTIKDIVAYVGSLGHAGEPIPEIHPGDRAEGQSLFITHCAACHNTSGTGVIVVDGDPAPQLYHNTPRQIAEAIRTGPGQMPVFSDKEVDQTQLDDLVAYASSLGDQQVRGGNGLDQFGPIFEGSIAWLIPVPALIIVLLLLGQRRKKQ